jgi:hypothetical protein
MARGVPGPGHPGRRGRDGSGKQNQTDEAYAEGLNANYHVGANPADSEQVAALRKDCELTASMKSQHSADIGGGVVSC